MHLIRLSSTFSRDRTFKVGYYMHMVPIYIGMIFYFFAFYDFIIYNHSHAHTPNTHPYASHFNIRPYVILAFCWFVFFVDTKVQSYS